MTNTPGCDEALGGKQEVDSEARLLEPEVENGSTEDEEDDSHQVRWTIYTALSLPTGEDAGVASPVTRAQRHQSSYRVEYQFPGDGRKVRADITMLGPVGRIRKGDKFTPLRTWREGDQTWVGWTKSFTVSVDRDVLTRLLPPETIKLQIWSDVVKTGTAKSRSSCGSNTSKKHQRQTGILSATGGSLDLQEVKKSNSASAEVSLTCLFTGETTMTQRIPVCSSAVLEVVCSISLDKPLLSDRLKAELNPLIITVWSATSMPSSPVSFQTLQEKCAPVYCQYKFPNLSTHRTNRHQHQADIHFRDVKVILSGLMPPEELRELLSGPPLEIEVHDRDLKPDPGAPPSAQSAAVTNPHGVARLNLSELLLGKKSLKAHLPIKRCPPPPDRKQSAWSRKRADGAAGRKPMPPGHYLEANSQLKVKVEIARPLSGGEPESSDAPFGRIVYLFHSTNSSAMAELRSQILSTNAAAFRLGSRSPENMEAALSNYAMNFKHRGSKGLDFVSGFHVVDGRTHVVVLEGLKHEAVRRLWDAVPTKLSGSEEEQVIVLHKPSLGFFKRIYDSLDISLSPIHLSESLQDIMRKPLVYVRGVVPQLCFQALSRLNQIRQARRLKDVVQWDLFPSADMILSMSEEYGSEPREQEVVADTEVDAPPLPDQVRIKRHAPLDTHNPEYMKRLWLKQSKDFPQDNIQNVREQSERVKKPKATMFKLEQPAAKPAHIYSIQTFNWREEAKELLHQQMAQTDQRFTYCQQYHSATVAPGDKTPKNDSRPTGPLWLSSRTSGEPRAHPKQPDEARVDELRKPWRENVLHAGKLKPTLNRERWASSSRQQDFQLYGKPPPLFSSANAQS